jgi:hypothetical protein
LISKPINHILTAAINLRGFYMHFVVTKLTYYLWALFQNV